MQNTLTRPPPPGTGSTFLQRACEAFDILQTKLLEPCLDLAAWSPTGVGTRPSDMVEVPQLPQPHGSWLLRGPGLKSPDEANAT